MGDVLVKKGSVQSGRITTLEVELHGLGSRTIDRDTAVAWMRDGHSFIPWVGGRRGAALQLVQAGEDGWVIRTDNAAEDADLLGDLPTG
ncbi:MAG: hypothetical protein ACI8PZ_002194 [Myxococcota bacterium]|jgi:hypothetical protein